MHFCQINILNTSPAYFQLIKNTDYSYSITHHKIDLLDFICLDPEFKGSSQAGFNGGYIGFISYDFAAQQHLKIHIEYKNSQVYI